MDPITFTVRKHPSPNEVWVDFGLQLVGSLPVHSLTTMPMLPWVVAEVRRLSGQSSIKAPAIKQVRLCVSPSGLRCEPEPGKSQQWDPLICSSIFECKPQHVHKLIHNSHDPSYFACLIKDDAANKRSICYVFKADDQTKKANKLVTAPLLTGELRNAHARPPLQLSATQDSEDAMSIHVVKMFNVDKMFNGQEPCRLVVWDILKTAYENEVTATDFYNEGKKKKDDFMLESSI